MNTSVQVTSAATNGPEATGLTGLAMDYLRLENAADARFEASMLEPDDGSEDDAQHRAIVADQRALVSLMATAPSQSTFDIQAKARVLDTLVPTPLTPHGNGGIPHGHLIRSLLNDILITRVERRSDAEIIHLCAEFDAHERAWLEILHANPGAACGSSEEAAIEASEVRTRDAQAQLLERILTLRAATLDGARAIARSLALWDAELLKDGGGDTGQRLTAALVASLIGPEPIARSPARLTA